MVKTPVEPIYHSYGDANSQLSVGRPFFLDILREGIILYEADGYPFAKPGKMTDAQKYFDEWYALSRFNLKTARSFFDQIQTDGKVVLNASAFLAHQATERI